MPHKPKPAPVFVARSNDFLKTNFGLTEDGTVYIIEWRKGYCAGNQKPATERVRKMAKQKGPTAEHWRAKLSIDSKQPKA